MIHGAKAKEKLPGQLRGENAQTALEERYIDDNRILEEVCLELLGKSVKQDQAELDRLEELQRRIADIRQRFREALEP